MNTKVEAVTDVDKIARGLMEAEWNFLLDLYNKMPVGPADKVADKARQKCKRLGLAEFTKPWRRWKILPLGEAVVQSYKGTRS